LAHKTNALKELHASESRLLHGPDGTHALKRDVSTLQRLNSAMEKMGKSEIALRKRAEANYLEAASEVTAHKAHIKIMEQHDHQIITALHAQLEAANNDKCSLKSQCNSLKQALTEATGCDYS